MPAPTVSSAHAVVGGHHRRELRRTFALPEKPCGDFLVHCFCSLCALCQEAREIKRRSAVHPAPRLAAALERRGQPPEVQRMTRTYSHGLALEDWEWDSESGTVGVVRTKSRNLSGANAPGIAKAKAIRRTTTSLQDSGSLRGSVEPTSPLSGRGERSWIGRASDLDGKAAESAVAAEDQAAKVDNEPEGAAAPEPASAPGAAVPATRSFNFMSPFDGPDTAPPAAAASQRQLGRAVSFARATASSSGRGTELSGLSEAELDSLASRVSLDMASAARAAAQRIIAVDRQSHSFLQHRLNQLKEDEASGDDR